MATGLGPLGIQPRHDRTRPVSSGWDDRAARRGPQSYFKNPS
jgi:hypothetical protein